MGHANLRNISDFFVKRLYESGKLSVKECSDAMEKARVSYHASEGKHTEPYMLRMGLEDVLRFLIDPEGMGYQRRAGQPSGPIVVPVTPTPRQKKLLADWKRCDTEDWDCGDDGDGGDYGEFDAIKWRFSAPWLKLYPKIPKLGSITH